MKIPYGTWKILYVLKWRSRNRILFRLDKIVHISRKFLCDNSAFDGNPRWQEAFRLRLGKLFSVHRATHCWMLHRKFNRKSYSIFTAVSSGVKKVDGFRWKYARECALCLRYSGALMMLKYSEYFQYENKEYFLLRN